MKKKIIFFVNSYAGGAEKMTVNIAGFLPKEKYEIVFYILGKDKGLIEQFIPKDYKINRLVLKSYQEFFIHKIVKIIWIEKPDIIFSSLFPINWRICFAKLFFPKTKVIVRSNDNLSTLSFLKIKRLQIAYRFCKKLIVQTHEMKLEHLNILHLDDNKVLELSNPLNEYDIEQKVSNTTSPFSSNNINYVFAGRLSYVKGIDVLIKAFSIVVKKKENALLYVVGDNQNIFRQDYLHFLEIAKDLGIQDKIIFTGFTDNPYLYMKYADCFVLPSRNEGLPNVLLEALFLGTPVVSTISVPVIEKIIQNSSNGYTVAVEDIEGLADGMIKSIDLGRIVSKYKSSTKEDFVKVFN